MNPRILTGRAEEALRIISDGQLSWHVISEHAFHRPQIMYAPQGKSRVPPPSFDVRVLRDSNLVRSPIVDCIINDDEKEESVLKVSRL